MSKTQLVSTCQIAPKLPENYCLITSGKITPIQESDPKVTHIPGYMYRVVFTQFMPFRNFRQYKEVSENGKVVRKFVCQWETAGAE